MTHAAIDDPQRVAGVHAFRVLGRPPRHDLVAVADLAARVCGTPMATVNLLTDVEMHQIATTGFEGTVCSVEDSMCVRVLAEEGPVVVADCRLDPQFSDNPFVTGELAHVRFYATSRLVTRDGLVIGTLCVFDHEVRHLDDGQVDGLRTLAERVVDILELSLSTRELHTTLSEVEKIRAELEQSNERLASFAGQVSHDLKTPLTSVALSLDLVREQLGGPGRGRVDADAEALALLDRAISGSSRMATLIDHVLAYARVGGNLRHDDVDLERVVHDVCTDLWEALEGAKVEVGPLPIVSGDEVQLRALVQNLVDNAAKYADPARPAVIGIHALRSPGGWRVEVTDNGRGVPVDDLERIFEPLARADDTVSGSGIGLATCRRIVEAHGGRIGLLHAPQGGTTAWFELPSARD